MANLEQIEQELIAYLQLEPNIRKDDRLKYLMAIMNKHFELDKVDHMMNYLDLDSVISGAKREYATTNLPMRISHRDVQSDEVRHVLIIEAFVGYLNKNKLLRKLVKFNFTR